MSATPKPRQQVILVGGSEGMIPGLIDDFFRRHRTLVNVVEARLDHEKQELTDALGSSGPDESDALKSEEAEYWQQSLGEEHRDYSEIQNGFRQAIFVRYIGFAESMLLHNAGKERGNLSSLCQTIWDGQWKSKKESGIVSFLTTLRNALAHGSRSLVIGRIAISGIKESEKKVPITNYKTYLKARKEAGKSLAKGLKHREDFCQCLNQTRWLRLASGLRIENITKGAAEEGHIDFFEASAKKPRMTGAWCDLEWIQPMALDVSDNALEEIACFLETLLLAAWRLQLKVR